MKEPTKRITISLPQSLYDALYQRAKADNRTPANYIRYLLHQFLR